MKNVSKEIKVFASKFNKEFTSVLSAIKRYDRIAIFRHIVPDFDALGTQFGLATWIKDNFPSKEVKVLGDNHVSFTPRLFPKMDELSEEWFKSPFLAIIVDVNGDKRIADPRYKKAKFKIIIDHHPLDNNVKKAQTIIDNTSSAAASEIVSSMLIYFNSKGYQLSKEAARYLHIALVGDSGKFSYSSTSVLTFDVAKQLLSTGFDVSEVNRSMFFKSLDDLKVTSYILSNFKVSEHGIAYYVLTNEVQKQLNITTERGKDNVNLFANIDGINAWCSITEDGKEPCFRISIRSKEKDISEVARLFNGGGHKQASGAKINSLNELDSFIKALDDLFI